jgi:sporulation-control protein spo0M
MTIAKKMISNKQIMPKPFSSYGSIQKSNANLSDTANGLAMTAIDKSAFARARLTKGFALKAGAYVANANVSFSGAGQYSLNVEDDSNAHIASLTKSTLPGTFTIDKDTNVHFVLAIAAGNATGSVMTVSNIGIYKQADWQAMQSIGINYFDGSTNLLSNN